MKDARIGTVAMVTAAVMLGHQVAGKAFRDSFFLSHFPAEMLPRVGIAAAALTVVFVLVFSRFMRRFGPSRVVPAGFFLSAVLHVVEHFHAQDAPAAWSLVIYFHIVALGAILLSGFWSLMAEAFNPRAAKRIFGRIAGFGTLGGILGGLLATRFSSASVLLLLAAFHLSCSVLLASAKGAAPAPVRESREDSLSPVRLLRRAPYLGMIALVVVAGTSSAFILDYLFKARASVALDKEDLRTFFTFFYVATQGLTFLAQTFLAQGALQHFGIGRTIAALPVGVGAGALGAVLIPGLPMFTLIRSLESILRGSFYRSAYELLYTPVPPAEKRAAKTLIDVGCDRSGDALGALIVQLFLWGGIRFVGAETTTALLLGAALSLAAVGIWISLRLDGVYTKLVQERLVDRAVEFDIAEIRDSTTRSVFIRVPAPAAPAPKAAPALSTFPAKPTDAMLDTLRELRSGDSQRVFAAIREIRQPAPPVAAQLVRLLAWDEVSNEAREVLQLNPTPVTGLLVDHLTNPDVLFGIRRRVPRILARSDSQLAASGLLAGLEDQRFEVRFQCSRALDALKQRRPGLKVPADAVYAAVERELKVAHPIWNSRRLLDRRADADQNAYLDDVLRERADQSLEHVFSLFAAVLPRDPVKIAFRALHTEDKTLRGLAAEYLDSMLPPHIRELLWKMVEPGLSKGAPAQESGQAALDRLLQSHESLMIMIDKDKLR